MISTSRIYKIAVTCRDSVIGIQSDQLSIFKRTDAVEEQTKYFNEELQSHEENWVKVMTRMRKVWKNMKSEFQLTRQSVEGCHKRLTRLEKWVKLDDNPVYTDSELTTHEPEQSGMQEFFDDFDRVLDRVKTLEQNLAQVAKTSSGERIRQFMHGAESRFDKHATRLGRLERADQEATPHSFYMEQHNKHKTHRGF